MECYTSRQNAQIHRNGEINDGEKSDSAGDFDERKQLLAETLRENDVVVAAYTSS